MINSTSLINNVAVIFFEVTILNTIRHIFKLRDHFIIMDNPGVKISEILQIPSNWEIPNYKWEIPNYKYISCYPLTLDISSWEFPITNIQAVIL